MKARFSFSIRIALLFMMIFFSALLLLSFCFITLQNRIIHQTQEQELLDASKILQDSFLNGQDFFDIPYHITYSIYENQTKEICFSNDPFLPTFDSSNGKTVHYFEKDYFIDGDLNLMYLARAFYADNKFYTVVTALNMDNDVGQKLLAALPKTIAIASIPVLILSFLFCYLLTRNTIKPVVKITKAAREISSSNLEKTLPLGKYNDEIDELSQTFNKLFKQLKIDFDRERQFSIDVSHELKTPIAVILGQTNLLLRWGKEDPEQLEKSLNSIKSEGISMQKIIENLLEICRVESGQIKPLISKVNIESLFLRLQNEVKTLAPKAKFSFKIEDVKMQNKEGFFLSTDEEMLHQIFTIVISNSLKFAGDECSLFAEAYMQGQKCVLLLQDDGRGFSEQNLPFIFERFFREDKAHSRENGGFGLGLSIARVLANALDAEIFAENAKDVLGNNCGARIKLVF